MEPHFHDGRLYSIRLRRDGSLELELSTADGTPYLLELAGLERLHANNFMQGNIVFDVSVFNGANCPQDALIRLLGINDEVPPKAHQRIINENWTLLVVGSSYGCELEALGTGGVTIRPMVGVIPPG